MQRRNVTNKDHDGLYWRKYIQLFKMCYESISLVFIYLLAQMSLQIMHLFPYYYIFMMTNALGKYD